jgi:hypothetical protein
MRRAGWPSITYHRGADGAANRDCHNDGAGRNGGAGRFNAGGAGVAVVAVPVGARGVDAVLRVRFESNHMWLAQLQLGRIFDRDDALIRGNEAR